MSQKLKIAVAGAGIGGLAAAALLHDAGHTVTVYDQFSHPEPVGSGLVIQPVGQEVLAEIGLRAQAIAAGAKITRMFGHDATHNRPVLDVSYDRGAPGAFGLAIHRASLFNVLWSAVAERQITVQGDAAVQAAENGNLTLADGRRIGPFDLIVDATGAASPLSPLASKPLPYGAIWGTVDWPSDTELPRDELRQVYRAANRMIGVLPLGVLPNDDTPKAAIFWSMPAGSHAAWLSAGLTAWRAEATALWPQFAPFADQITAPEQMTMARYTHGTLRKPYGDKIVHIGDAAHRASPQLGQGANMALLDALTLTRALTLANGQDPLWAYATARRAHVWCYQAFSRAFTPQYQSDSRWLPVLRDRALFPLSQIGPTPAVLSALVRGSMIPPLGSLNRR